MVSDFASFASSPFFVSPYFSPGRYRHNFVFELWLLPSSQQGPHRLVMVGNGNMSTGSPCRTLWRRPFSVSVSSSLRASVADNSMNLLSGHPQRTQGPLGTIHISVGIASGNLGGVLEWGSCAKCFVHCNNYPQLPHHYLVKCVFCSQQSYLATGSCWGSCCIKEE